jgi:MFS family permease
MLFLLFGMLSMSIFSGRYISRTQRYRLFPIIGTLLIVIVLGLLSRLTPDTPMWQVDSLLAALGLGLGMTMQVMVLTAQFSVTHLHLGVATSTVSLFRSMGGVLGVAAFGAVFSHFMSQELRDSAHQSSAMIVHALHINFLTAATISLIAFGLAFLLEEIHQLTQHKVSAESPENMK